MTLRVSVITSVLNGVATLSDCLSSVANQTLSCEHIVVDAGSTDGSQDMTRNLGSPVRLIVAPGASISRAFNLGIQQASGDLIGILNADDWYEPDAIARTVQAMEQAPVSGFSYGSVIVHNPDHDFIAKPLAYGLFARQCVVQMPFFHISSLVRRSVYEKFGTYDEQYRVAMDFDFYARVITQGVSGVSVPGIIGHVRGGGLSTGLGRRSREYFRISRQHIGVAPAAYHAARFAGRSMLFAWLVRFPAGKRLLAARRARRFELVERA